MENMSKFYKRTYVIWSSFFLNQSGQKSSSVRDKFIIGTFLSYSVILFGKD